MANKITDIVPLRKTDKRLVSIIINSYQFNWYIRDNKKYCIATSRKLRPNESIILLENNEINYYGFDFVKTRYLRMLKYIYANDELELTKKYLKEFIDSNKQLSDTNVEWQKLENSIAETKKEMNEVFNQNVRNRIEWYTGTVDVLSAKLDSLYGSDKIKGINEQNGYLKLQQEEIKRLIAQLENQRSSLNSVSDEYAELSSEIFDLNAEWWKIEETIKEKENDSNE